MDRRSDVCSFDLGETLVTWTSNIQGWISHGGFEFSNKMQTIEIYTAQKDADGTVTGLRHEAILYDPEALKAPVRIVLYLKKTVELGGGGIGDARWRERGGA